MATGGREAARGVSPITSAANSTPAYLTAFIMPLCSFISPRLYIPDIAEPGIYYFTRQTFSALHWRFLMLKVPVKSVWAVFWMDPVFSSSAPLLIAGGFLVFRGGL
jgi:hypothetical protein